MKFSPSVDTKQPIVFAMLLEMVDYFVSSSLLTPIFSESGFHEFPLKSMPGVPIWRADTDCALFARGANADESDVRAAMVRMLHALERFMVVSLLVVVAESFRFNNSVPSNGCSL